MAIDWGGYNGHLRVGIEAVISPANPSHSDTSVTVTWKYYVGTDGWNFADPQALHESADGWGGTTTNFTNNLTSGSMLVDTHKETYAISYNSGSKSASANLTGAYNGASPSHSVNVNLPNRPIATPSAGENPSAGTITSSGVTITWSVPTDNGGASVDNYEVQISTGSGFGSGLVVDHTMGSTSRTYTTSALDPNQHYYVRVRAHNSAGWGNWTSATGCQFTTLSGLPTVPTGLSTTNRTKNSLTIGWKASASNGGGTVTYTVEVYSDVGLTTLVLSTTTTNTSILVAALTPATTYYTRIKASNTNGSSGWSTTLTSLTLGSGVYNDSGDYVALVNNLASAVADKLTHLGVYSMFGKTGNTTIPTSTAVTLTMGTGIGFRGPDAPTHIGSGTSDFQINYPGTYLIEFSFRFDEGLFSPSSAGHVNMYVLVNGNVQPASTLQAGGESVLFTPAGNSATQPWRKVTIARTLSVGDTIGWQVWQNSGSSMTPPTPGGTDLYTYARVTLIGF